MINAFPLHPFSLALPFCVGHTLPSQEPQKAAQLRDKVIQRLPLQLNEIWLNRLPWTAQSLAMRAGRRRTQW